MQFKVIPFTLLLIAACITGCQEEQLPTFDTDMHYVHFEKMWDEPIRFSFQTTPDEDEHRVEIPVTLIGLALPEAMDYSVSIVTEDNPFVAGNQEYIKGHIVSVKNPKSGEIIADSVGEIIREDAIMKCTGIVKIRQ